MGEHSSAKLAHVGTRSEVILSEFIDPKDWLGWVQALGVIISKGLLPLEKGRTLYRKFPPFQKEKR